MIKQPLTRNFIFCGAINLFALCFSNAWAGDVKCKFAAHLHCSDHANISWSIEDINEPTLFVQDSQRLYLSHNNAFKSFDITTGDLLWQHKTHNGARYFYPVLDQQSIYLAREDGRLEKRQASTGDLQWSKQIGKGWVYPPAIINGILFTGGQDRTIWAIGEQSGEILYHFDLNHEVVTPLLAIKDVFIISTFDGKLHAYGINNKTPIWTIQLDAAAFKLTEDSNKIIASTMAGSIEAISPKQGRSLWRQTPHQNAQFWNLIHQQKLYSINHQGQLSILNLTNGQLEASYHFPDHYDRPPRIEGNTLILRSTSSHETRIPLIHAPSN